MGFHSGEVSGAIHSVVMLSVALHMGVQCELFHMWGRLVCRPSYLGEIAVSSQEG